MDLRHTDDDSRIRPDIVVKLPKDIEFIIDSKVKLLHYYNYCNNGEQEKDIKYFIDSIKSEIDDLSKRKYQQAKGLENALYVFMFIPMDSSYLFATQKDPTLYEYASKKHIALTCPALLMPTLKMVYALWQQENAGKNARIIGGGGRKLYDKIVLMAEVVGECIKSLNKAQSLHETLAGHLTTGKGNIKKRIEDMRQLGARASKDVFEDPGRYLVHRSEDATAPQTHATLSEVTNDIDTTVDAKNNAKEVGL